MLFSATKAHEGSVMPTKNKKLLLLSLKEKIYLIKKSDQGKSQTVLVDEYGISFGAVKNTLKRKN